MTFPVSNKFKYLYCLIFMTGGLIDLISTPDEDKSEFINKSACMTFGLKFDPH